MPLRITFPFSSKLITLLSTFLIKNLAGIGQEPQSAMHPVQPSPPSHLASPQSVSSSSWRFWHPVSSISDLPSPSLSIKSLHSGGGLKGLRYTTPFIFLISLNPLLTLPVTFEGRN